MKYLPKQMVEGWAAQRNKLRGSASAPRAQYDAFVAVRARIIKALDDEGAGVLLGADTPQVMQVPGWATHGELRALAASGLTPYRALRAGTANVARYFGTEVTTGTIAAGKEASLILVDANPLANVGNALRISGVVVRGTWLPKADLDAKLAALPPM
jgi:imidazolonepropionase-like amidohydrolase